MSLTQSAAAAMLTVVDAPIEVHEPSWGDQTDSRDLYTQFVISLTIGLGAFLAFCVSSWKSLGNSSSLTSRTGIGSATEMDRALCRAEKTALRRIPLA